MLPATFYSTVQMIFNYLILIAALNYLFSSDNPVRLSYILQTKIEHQQTAASSIFDFDLLNADCLFDTDIKRLK